jgi:hypothetical protein
MSGGIPYARFAGWKSDQQERNRMKKFTKKQMKKIKALSKRYGIGMHEAAKMLVQSGI